MNRFVFIMSNAQMFTAFVPETTATAVVPETTAIAVVPETTATTVVPKTTPAVRKATTLRQNRGGQLVTNTNPNTNADSKGGWGNSTPEKTPSDANNTVTGKPKFVPTPKQLDLFASFLATNLAEYGKCIILTGKDLKKVPGMGGMMVYGICRYGMTCPEFQSGKCQFVHCLRYEVYRNSAGGVKGVSPYNRMVWAAKRLTEDHHGKYCEECLNCAGDVPTKSVVRQGSVAKGGLAHKLSAPYNHKPVTPVAPVAQVAPVEQADAHKFIGPLQQKINNECAKEAIPTTSTMSEATLKIIGDMNNAVLVRVKKSVAEEEGIPFGMLDFMLAMQADIAQFHQRVAFLEHRVDSLEEEKRCLEHRVDSLEDDAARAYDDEDEDYVTAGDIKRL